MLQLKTQMTFRIAEFSLIIDHSKKHSDIYAIHCYVYQEVSCYDVVQATLRNPQQSVFAVLVLPAIWNICY